MTRQSIRNEEQAGMVGINTIIDELRRSWKPRTPLPLTHSFSLFSVISIISMNFNICQAHLTNLTTGSPISEWSIYFEYLFRIFNRYNI